MTACDFCLVWRPGTDLNLCCMKYAKYKVNVVVKHYPENN